MESHDRQRIKRMLDTSRVLWVTDALAANRLTVAAPAAIAVEATQPEKTL
jgi:hypothetical protein